VSGPSPRSDLAAATGEPTRSRLLDAAIRCLVREGVEGASLSAIAGTAEVSKALLHYHFVDRTRLLTEVLGQLTVRTIARERAAIDHVKGSRVLDALWEWLAGELARGELRALLELGTSHDRRLHAAVEEARARRHRAATRTVEVLFGQLGLTPRVPAPLLGAASLTFVDGLAIGGIGGDGTDARVSFDVFWLALLGLVP
jgi:AcrR family transcriptional regulator